jgi:hypothetical protein
MTSDATEKVRGWLAGRLPEEWFDGAPEVTVDRDEITVVGRIAAPRVRDEATEAERAAAEAGKTKEFRARTRDQRMRIARELGHRTGRKVAWGVTCGERTELFTNLSAPVMTRLRQPERQVLDTLVDAGVARSRSEALAWCVRLVGKHTEEWLRDLRTAMEQVERIRADGPPEVQV